MKMLEPAGNLAVEGIPQVSRSPNTVKSLNTVKYISRFRFVHPTHSAELRGEWQCPRMDAGFWAVSLKG